MDILQMPQNIKDYLDNMLTEAGITDVQPEVKEEMIKELFVRLDNYIASVLIEQLPPEHLDQFIKMNEEQKSSEEIEKYLAEHVPNTGEIFAKAFADFRDMYVGSVQIAKEQDTL